MEESMKHIRIGIVGSRRRNSVEDFRRMREFLQGLLESIEFDTVKFVSGGCPKGADHFAELIAETIGVEIKIYHPNLDEIDEELLAANPKAAHAIINYARNGLIAENSDILVAMVAPNRLGGTEDTIRKFKKIHGARHKLFII
jgi:hypothetical protein